MGGALVSGITGTSCTSDGSSSRSTSGSSSTTGATMVSCGDVTGSVVGAACSFTPWSVLGGEGVIDLGYGDESSPSSMIFCLAAACFFPFFFLPVLFGGDLLMAHGSAASAAGWAAATGGCSSKLSSSGSKPLAEGIQSDRRNVGVRCYRERRRWQFVGMRTRACLAAQERESQAGVRSGVISRGCLHYVQLLDV